MPHSIFSLLLSTPITTVAAAVTTTMPSHSPLSFKPRKSSTTSHHHSSSSPLLICRHHSLSSTSTATLDLLIFILVLFSGAFLLSSYFSYLFHSLSLLVPPHFPLLSSLIILLLVAVFVFEICFGFFRSRKCGNPKCKGLKKALEFDLQLHTEDSLKSGTNEIDRLPWKGGTETNPDYECLRAELRKMAPPNGRAVLLFRDKCGCPVAKLVGWAPKKGRKHKKALANIAANADYR